MHINHRISLQFCTAFVGGARARVKLFTGRAGRGMGVVVFGLGEFFVAEGAVGFLDC